MREILFHGKTINEPVNIWVEGFYSCFTDEHGELKHYIRTITADGKPGRMYEVHPDSVGQYIGMDDQNGLKVFERDILQFRSYVHVNTHTC